MKELLTYIVENLFPIRLRLPLLRRSTAITLPTLPCSTGDMGRVIGRHGRIAKEIRTLTKAAGNRENKRHWLIFSTEPARIAPKC